jgi:hypothetical protein
MAESVKVTTIGEKVLLRKVHNFYAVGRFHLQYMQSLTKFCSRALTLRIKQMSRKGERIALFACDPSRRSVVVPA